MRGRKLRYEIHVQGDDLVTRPMKHRVREAIFDLVGTEVASMHAIDLFAGTGALGLEALSRGAAHATFVERHHPTARALAANIAALDVEPRTTLQATSAFLWARRDAIALATANRNQAPSRTPAPPSPFPLPASPWLVFISPPYDFYADRCDEMLDLVARMMNAAPPESILIVEADDRFDMTTLPTVGETAKVAWDVRPYLPAVVAVGRL